MLLASLCCSVVSYIWLGFADALWMLFAARLLAGAGAGNIAAAQAYITDVTAPEARAKGMGMIGAAFGLGFTLGPALGGMLAGSDPGTAALARPAFAAALLSATALVLAAIILKESLPPELRGLANRPGRVALAKDAWRKPHLRALILIFFLTTCAFAGLESTFALWANSGFGWGPLQVGWIFFYVGLVLALVQGGLIGRLSRRFGEARLATYGAALLAFGLVSLPFSTTLAAVLVGLGAPFGRPRLLQSGGHEPRQPCGLARGARRHPRRQPVGAEPGAHPRAACWPGSSTSAAGAMRPIISGR